jgi:hypothetical protein
MNDKQWYTFGVLLWLASLFFIGKAIEASTGTILGSADQFVYLAGSVKSAIYGSVGTLTMVLGVGCVIAGYLETKH